MRGSRLESRLDELVAGLEVATVRARRHLHKHPELGWQEFETQRFLRDWLTERGLEPRDCANTGLLVDIGENDGPGVIYRGDIDALPIHETKPDDVTYTSTNEGVAHACGHDFHASVAASLAAVFHELRDDLPGRVRVLLQPAEEVVPSGAEAMIREGAAQGMDAALALHVDPARDVGHVGLRTGPLTSATDTFTIKVVGKAGHSARPHLANDAILAASDIIRSLYTLISQRVNPLVPAVLNVGTIHGGEAKNVIAGQVVLDGVVRTLNLDARETLHREMRDVARAVARVHGCEVQVVVTTGAPPVMNDTFLHEVVGEAVVDVLGKEGVQSVSEPSTGAEDFGMFGLHMPTYMARLGVRSPGSETTHLHTSTFDLDERAIPIAMRVMGRAVLRTLARFRTDEPSAA